MSTGILHCSSNRWTVTVDKVNQLVGVDLCREVGVDQMTGADHGMEVGMDQSVKVDRGLIAGDC